MSAKRHIFPCLLIAASCTAQVRGVVADYAPLAVGNWWEYTTNTGTQRTEITGTAQDSFVFRNIYISGAQRDTIRAAVVSTDSFGMFYEYRDEFSGFVMYGGMQGPHFAFPSNGTFVTPHGTFSSVDTFVNFRHGAGWVADLYAAGIGPVGRIEEYWSTMYVQARLTAYHCAPTPAAYSHSYALASQGAAAFSYQWLGSDTVEIRFIMSGRPCAAYYGVGSHHTIRNCLRIYLADTSRQKCTGSVEYIHTMRIRSVDPARGCGVKVLRVDSLANPYENIRTVCTGTIPPRNAATLNRPAIAHNREISVIRFFDVRGRSLHDRMSATMCPAVCIAQRSSGRCELHVSLQARSLPAFRKHP